jgi:hypothetical protein
METCLILTELDPETVEAGFNKARECLRNYKFTENRYSSEDEIEKYKQRVARSEQSWSEILKSGFKADLAALLARPEQWIRLEGEIEIEDQHHFIEFFIYPTGSNKAGVSIAFSSSIYDAIYSSKPSFEHVIDLNVKQDFVNFLLLIAMSFSARAFALKILTNAEDTVMLLRVSDIQEWLTVPSSASKRGWVFLIVGIRAELVDRQKVEKKWTAERVMQSASGFLFYDGFLSYSKTM